MQYFPITGTWEPTAPGGSISAEVSIQMLVQKNGVLAIPAQSKMLVPVTDSARISNGILSQKKLLSNTPDLNLDGDLFYEVSFQNAVYNNVGQQALQPINLPSVTFQASSDSTPIDLSTVTPSLGVVAAQLPSVISQNISDATTLGRELLTAASPAAALAELGAASSAGPPVWPFPMARNTIAAVGDSITAIGTAGWFQPWMGHCYLNQLCVLSHQRIRYGAGNFAVAGTLSAQQLSIQLPQVLAMDPLPGACVVAIGTNDLQNPNYNFAASIANLKAIVSALVSAGVVPVLWTPPPNEHVSAVPLATIHARTYQWNTAIRRYAAMNGYPLIDAHRALAQIDGTPKPGTLTSGSDEIHPTGYGHRLIAERALADGIANWFPPNSLVNTSRQTEDLSNMFGSGTLNWGLFTTDANSDGVADGLSVDTPGAAALVAPSPNEQVFGNWQQLTAAANATHVLVAVFSTGWSIGDRIAMSCRIKTANIESNSGLHMAALKSDIPSGMELPDNSSSVTFVWGGPVQWDCDISNGEVYVEYTVPPGASDLQLWLSVFGGTAAGSSCSLSVAEMTVRNLTAGGILI